ncbi:hypothetical protein [Zavarzinia sp. CC-PAN008]|uniref:hypothetical protein n=1 Tax=Zavarzinia sp. CC-PAN008 TaxID=3243332 RepID=UPI003F74975F
MIEPWAGLVLMLGVLFVLVIGNRGMLRSMAQNRQRTLMQLAAWLGIAVVLALAYRLFN